MPTIAPGSMTMILNDEGKGWEPEPAHLIGRDRP